MCTDLFMALTDKTFWLDIWNISKLFDSAQQKFDTTKQLFDSAQQDLFEEGFKVSQHILCVRPNRF